MAAWVRDSRFNFFSAMNKLVFALCLLSTGATSFWLLHQATAQARTACAAQHSNFETASVRLAELDSTATSVRGELAAKRQKLQGAASQHKINLDLLSLLKAGI